MEKNIKNTIYATSGLVLLGLNSVDAAFDIDWSSTRSSISNSEGGQSVFEAFFGYIIWLFYFIAVIYWVYAWFLIITAWWDEEKVKKWKTGIINVAIWLVVIFLASSIINWIVQVLQWGVGTGTVS